MLGRQRLTKWTTRHERTRESAGIELAVDILVATGSKSDANAIEV